MRPRCTPVRLALPALAALLLACSGETPDLPPADAAPPDALSADARPPDDARPAADLAPDAGPDAGAAASPCAADIAQNTVGLVHCTKTVEPGILLFQPLFSYSAFLINRAGKLVNRWDTGTLPALSTYLLPDGSLIRGTYSKNSNYFMIPGVGGLIERRSWDNTVTWAYEYCNRMRCQHHDIEPLPSGNVLMAVWVRKSRVEALAAGRDPNKLQGDDLLVPELVEVRPTGPTSGQVVWVWRLWDHLIQDYNPRLSNFGEVSAHPERVDINYAPISIADWVHINGIQYNPQLKQIIISAHNFDEIWVIRHGSSTLKSAGSAGHLLYRWGNPRAYRQGDASDHWLFGQHDARWVPAGSVGAGHITVFDNGYGRPGEKFSRVLEIAAPLATDGTYRRRPNSAFGPGQPVWNYTATPKSALWASRVSGAMRLPGGNTLITEGSTGTFHEVSRSGRLIWRYINPETLQGPMTQGEPAPERSDYATNQVFRATHYPLDYPAFSGRNLAGKGTIELPAKSR